MSGRHAGSQPTDTAVRNRSDPLAAVSFAFVLTGLDDGPTEPTSIDNAPGESTAIDTLLRYSHPSTTPQRNGAKSADLLLASTAYVLGSDCVYVHEGGQAIIGKVKGDGAGGEARLAA